MSGGGRTLMGEGLREDINHYIRRRGHLTEFAMLGAALMLHINYIYQYIKKINYKKIVAVTMLVVVLYAISDEFHQMFVPGRGPGVKDVVIDSIGGVLGCLLMLFIIKKIVKKRNNRQTANMDNSENEQS